MIVDASAPTRVDLAGGTVDIWPLYLFHENAVTVNFAIDLTARCRITERPDRRIVLRSLDTKEEIECDRIDPLASTPTLKLLAKLVHVFAPTVGFEMVTESVVPPGSGLAGSSALNVAICGALNEFTKAGYDLDGLIRIAKNVEAQVIDVPTGDQDYYPAAYGGVSAIQLTPRGVMREEVTVDLERLSQRLILIYSGRSRNSGINNWEVMKRRIDGDKVVSRAFEGIISAANSMLSALRLGDFDRIDAALDQEWAHRQSLSDGIATPEIREIIARAQSIGAGSAKVCGAGGGGCVLLSVPEGRKGSVEGKLRESGVRVIDYRIVREGLSVRSEDSPRPAS